ncbi:hypothetical protein D3C87_1364590 [compost metagenome]
MHSKVKRYMEYLFHVLLAGDVSGRSWIIVARGPAVPAAEALTHCSCSTHAPPVPQVARRQMLAGVSEQCCGHMGRNNGSFKRINEGGGTGASPGDRAFGMAGLAISPQGRAQGADDAHRRADGVTFHLSDRRSDHLYRSGCRPCPVWPRTASWQGCR